MGKFGLALSIFMLLLSYLVYCFFASSYDENLMNTIQTWADENKFKIELNTKAEQFKIEFDSKEWVNLLHKLGDSRYFNELEDAKKFEFGFDIEYAKDLVQYWKNDFNWKKQVDHLNKFRHFKMMVNGVTLHYMRVNDNENKKSDTKKRVPLLLLSGWPGSFYEFYKLIDYINENYNTNEKYFDIVVPSIPGFAYSSPLTKKFDQIDTALTYDYLMRFLFGEDCKYFVHGEDWGSLIGTILAQLYPLRIYGFQTTMPVTMPRPSIKSVISNVLLEIFPNYILTKEEKELNVSFTLTGKLKRILFESGYFHQQATKPDTIGVALSDSPVGLMAYILEKYSAWSANYENEILNSKNGGLNKISKDELLTIVTIYWMTNTITSSMRYYKCFIQMQVAEWPKSLIAKTQHIPKSVPLAVLYSENEISISPKYLIEQHVGTLTLYTIINDGSHFSAFYKPEFVAKDLMKFVNIVLN